LVQGGIGAGQFDHPISAASLCEVPNRKGKITVFGRQP
jgi:hypothetical protein